MGSFLNIFTNDQSQQQRLTSSISKLYSNSIHNDDDSNENILSPDDDDNDRTITNKQQNLLTKLSSSASLTTSNKLNGTLLLTKLANIGCKDKLLSSDNDDNERQIIIVNNIPLTIDQIICICQILQRCDLKKLEKFIYNLPNDAICNQNELIIRARAIAAYHSGNFKQVYHLLESNEFPLKYHQELQLLWNNAHYKEHEMKRGHPPGAVEKYRIRKKYQFPRTIWDGEEYVYCFKEKNRRILKEFYLKCNLPTQEDKLKLSNETQLTVVQISNWFKNRRQRDRQPHHHHHHDIHNDHEELHSAHQHHRNGKNGSYHQYNHHHQQQQLLDNDDD
ncbi:Sequence-specific DNA binding [Dermatophagoides pteronyssinus]|uniref:Sequence-specific DNA binding n=1 Tax=Dermatophagoides pteronyssinus TaxID=6956 RepID=A0ABQ8JVC3_DERPT|nr:Sequence-specific DNA binding [Dermatophagoides pteronyssinus]